MEPLNDGIAVSLEKSMRFTVDFGPGVPPPVYPKLLLPVAAFV
jgi:hypothetical protein